MERTKALIKEIFKSKGIATITGQHDVGKSCFIKNIVKHAIYDNKVVAVITSEYSKEYMFEHLISSIANINFIDLSKGKFNELEKINAAAEQISKSNLYVSAKTDIDDIVSSIKNLIIRLGKENKKIDLIIIDSLRYLINKRHKTIYDVFKYVNEELKELTIPMIVTYPISNEIKTPKSIRMNPTEEETKFIKDNSDIFISMEKNKETETIKLTINYYKNKTHITKYKFNSSTGEFIEK